MSNEEFENEVVKFTEVIGQVDSALEKIQKIITSGSILSKEQKGDLENLLEMLEQSYEKIYEYTKNAVLAEDLLGYDKRGRGEKSDHILALYRNNRQEEIHHRLWEAQVQILLPMIEMERGTNN